LWEHQLAPCQITNPITIRQSYPCPRRSAQMQKHTGTTHVGTHHNHRSVAVPTLLCLSPVLLPSMPTVDRLCRFSSLCPRLKTDRAVLPPGEQDSHAHLCNFCDTRWHPGTAAGNDSANSHMGCSCVASVPQAAHDDCAQAQPRCCPSEYARST
jgi:hypothetical protein